MSDWTPFFESEGTLSATEQEHLVRVFDSQDTKSNWSLALTLAGIQPAPQLLQWRNGVPGLAASEFIVALSAGYVAPDGRKRILRLPALLGSQWKMDQELARVLETAVPARVADQLTQSLFLGIAIQALRMRLPSSTETQFAAWLAGSSRPPASARATIARILKAQRRRDELARAWSACFPSVGYQPAESTEAPQKIRHEPHPSPSLTSVWRGLPVCAGQVVAPALWVTSDTQRPSEPRLLIFAQARPEAVEWYEVAAGLAFAQGGVLSHACSVAREQGIPSATGFGKSLASAGTSLNGRTVRLDGGAGTLEVI